MTKKARSARGEIIDFDLLAIKQQLAITPTSVGVNARRRFIDEKDGIKTKENFIVHPPAIDTGDSPLSIAKNSAKQSSSAKIF